MNWQNLTHYLQFETAGFFQGAAWVIWKALGGESKLLHCPAPILQLLPVIGPRPAFDRMLVTVSLWNQQKNILALYW